MATTRLMPLHVGKGRSVGTAISDIIDYVKNPDKTEQGQLVTSYESMPSYCCNYIVVGPYHSSAPDGLTNKLRRAKLINENGGNIVVLSETDCRGLFA